MKHNWWCLFLLAGCHAQAPGDYLVQFPLGVDSRVMEQTHARAEATVLASHDNISRVWVTGDRLNFYRSIGAIVESNVPVRLAMVGGFRPYYHSQMTPNDPLYHRSSALGQWWLDRINAPQAWDKVQGTPITVAVIDTGVDSSHPDLAANLLTGVNLLDQSKPPDDDYGHGTHVAGIIAAAANNAEGGAGLASSCKVLPIRVLGTTGGSTYDVVNGIDYAIKNGARVLNLSLGSSQNSQIEREAIKRALDAGLVVVAAAGNDALSGNPLNYPAAFPGVIGVTATDNQDKRALFSSYNSMVTVAAPGVDILSTLPLRFGRYGFASGTSMAAPIVSGAVALLLMRHPDWHAPQVIEALKSSSHDLSRESGKDVGYDPYFGWGLLDASEVLAQ